MKDCRPRRARLTREVRWRRCLTWSRASRCRWSCSPRAISRPARWCVRSCGPSTPRRAAWDCCRIPPSARRQRPRSRRRRNASRQRIPSRETAIESDIGAHRRQPDVLEHETAYEQRRDSKWKDRQADQRHERNQAVLTGLRCCRK